MKNWLMASVFAYEVCFEVTCFASGKDELNSCRIKQTDNCFRCLAPKGIDGLLVSPATD